MSKKWRFVWSKVLVIIISLVLFLAIIPIAMGANAISIRVRDGAGNVSVVEQYMIFKI